MGVADVLPKKLGFVGITVLCIRSKFSFVMRTDLQGIKEVPSKIRGL